MPIDVVIANSDRVLRFAIAHRAELFPDAPIVFCRFAIRSRPGVGTTVDIRLPTPPLASGVEMAI